MTTILIALGGTAAAAAVTWFFCMRPMLRKDGTADASCCVPAAPSIDDEIRSAKDELSRLQRAHTAQLGVSTVSRPGMHED